MRQHPVRAGVVATLASASMIGTIGLVTAGAATAAVSPEASVVINEVYGGGGNSGAVLSHDFVELRNTGTTPTDLSGWSLQYAGAAGTAWNNRFDLSGVIPVGATFLVQLASGGATGAALPAADATGNLNLSGSNGNVALVNSTTALSCQAAACAADDAVVDLVGFGTGAASAGAAAPAPSNSTSISRTDGVNTANNADDFTAGTPTPTNAKGQTEPGGEPDPEPTEVPTEEPTGGPGDGALERTIAQI